MIDYTKVTWSPWRTTITFKDGSTLRERSYTDGIDFGVESRVFKADGSLRPLPDGRTSPADDDVLQPTKDLP